MEKKEMDHFDMLEQAQSFVNVEDLDVGQFSVLPCELWIKARNSSGESPDELWHMVKFLNRAELMRDMYSQYVSLNKDLIALGKIRPPDIDPFYEPPHDSLIGVAYCFLDALSYKIEIHEQLSIINFKGAVVGELEVEIFPSMAEDAGIIEEQERDVDGVVYTTEEFAISKFIGKKMMISLNVKSAKGLPKRSCCGVFVSFPFFLQSTPFATSRCSKNTVNPWFNETFGVQQIITEDFIDYLSHSALEVEVWGAPESAIKSKFSSVQFEEGYSAGEEIVVDEIVVDAGGTIEEEELDAAYLAEQLEDIRGELKVQREVAAHEKHINEKALSDSETAFAKAKKKQAETEESLNEMKETFQAEKLRLEAALKAKSKICVVS